MLGFLPGPVIAALGMSIYFLILIVCAMIFMVMALSRFLIPLPSWRQFWMRRMKSLWEFYCALLVIISKLLMKTQWEIRGLEGLDPNGWYLLICNHVAATDIVVLQGVFNRKIPILKFFIKQELIWLPFAGLACWLMDFPFMKRHSKEQLQRNPALKYQDYQTTKKKCEKYREEPTSIINFVEGTRLTPVKHQRQQSPFQHLLKPKAGGIALVLAALGEQLSCIVNVTVSYAGGGGFSRFITGKIPKITVVIEKIPVTADLIGDYQHDLAYRKHFHQWLNGIWRMKDQQIEQLFKERS